MKRYGQVIRLKEEYEEEYRKLHNDPMPGVNDIISDCNITNYSIFLLNGHLFSYFEYVGDDFEQDMKKMAASEITKKWWALTDPCQDRFIGAAEGEWWATMEEVYHLD